MKLFKYLPFISAGILAAAFTSCENQDVTFADYEGGTSVYFAYQYPVRTLVMGEDEYDTTLDNQHKCKIYATMGGTYSNNKRITIDVAVDNNLCKNLYFEDNSPVKAMPSNYYTLADNKIVLNKTLSQGVEVQFTDAYFADPEALSNNYVIPLRMTNVTNADRILSGKPIIEDSNPDKCNSAEWDIAPKDYVLYCVKYINQWDANYLRRGIDKVTSNGITTTEVRHKEYVEKDEVCSVSTKNLNSAIFSVTRQVRENETVRNLTCDLVLTFKDNGECTIQSATAEYPGSGSGKYVIKGEKNSWGNKDRNALYLNYQIDFEGSIVATTDTLVVRDRGVSLEEFSPKYVE